MWKRVDTVDSFRGLYDLVTPKEDQDETIVKRFPDSYRMYTASYNSENVEAFAAIGFLPKSNVLMIDLLALDPSMRGKGLSRLYFQALFDFVAIEWPETKQTKGWMLEAYLHNVEPWCKILDMNIAETKIEPIKLHSPIRLLVSGNLVHYEEAYLEWQEFQKLW